MAETWSIKTSPSLPSSAIQWSSGFVSDGIYFTKITIGTDKITYTNSLGDTDVYTNSTWVKDNYRTVVFINSPSGTLLTWLNENAIKIVVSKKVISYDNLTVFKALMDNKYDILLDGKLDKIKGPFSGYDRLYAVSSNGVQYGVGYTSDIGKGTIVARNSTGEILVPTPTSDSGAVPKTYVDTSLDGKLDKIKTASSDGVYSFIAENSVDPFQSTSVFNPTTNIDVADIGPYVLQYKTIFGLNYNGYAIPMDSYNITTTSISVTRADAGPFMAFRFNAIAGKQYTIRLLTAQGHSVYFQYFAADGTRLGQDNKVYYNNYTVTVPTTYTKDVAYGVATVIANTKGTFTLNYFSITAIDAPTTQTSYPLMQGVVPYSIPLRTSDGNLKTGTPKYNADCVRLDYLNNALGKKLNKVTGSTTYKQAYVKDSNGSQVMWNISANKVENSIVQRNADNGVACNTQLFTEPDWYNNTTITTMPLVNMTASDKLIMLPLDNIIVEKSVDGGETWIAFDAGSEAQTNKQKRSLFTGANNYGMNFPKIDGKNSPLCMLRVTITGMTYNVPGGTAETERYNYWNKDNIKKSYRYCSINNMWFWLTAADNRIQIKVEGATGAAPDNWTEFGNIPNASGWSGADQLRINPERSFGGGVSQTTNYWNWRITFRAVGRNGETDGTNFNASTYNMNIISIKGFGKGIWTYGYNYLAGLNSIFKIRDNDYNFEMQQGSYYPALGSTYDLGNVDQRWRYVYAQYFSEGGVLLSDKYATIADLDNKLDKVTAETPLVQLYAKFASGKQGMVSIAMDDPRGGTIVQRGSEGQIKTADPVDALDAVNKQSMDTAVQDATVMVTDLRSGS